MTSGQQCMESCPVGYAMFHNTTLSSSPDENGCRYWSSFDFTSFAKGNRLKAYVGLLNGNGPRSGHQSIIKIFRDEAGSESMCNNEIQKSRKAQAFISPFRDFVSAEIRFHFTSLLKACMDDVCLFKNAMSGGRKLSKNEWVLIEEQVCKTLHLQCFVNRLGKANPSTTSHILEAFLHFTYHQSGGQLVICGLEGRMDDSRTCLKTPTIHSLSKDYGSSDFGERGIRKVFTNHVCNEMCKGLITPYIYPDRAEPSAPFDPDLATTTGEFEVSQYARYEQFCPDAFGPYFTFPPPPLRQLYPDLPPGCSPNKSRLPRHSGHKHPIST